MHLHPVTPEIRKSENVKIAQILMFYHIYACSNDVDMGT